MFKKNAKKGLAIFILIITSNVYAQHTDNLDVARESALYLNSRISSIEQLQTKTTRLYRKLLTRTGTSGQDIDSLLADTMLVYNNPHSRQLDSLRAIYNFGILPLDQTASGSEAIALAARLNHLEKLTAKTSKLEQLMHISLEGLSDKGASLKEIAGFKKDYEIIRSKINFYKKLYNEPDAAEAEALAYLQGIKGFDKQFAGRPSHVISMTDLAADINAEELSAMGFQTKESVRQHLTPASGDFDVIGQLFSSQIQQFQESGHSIAGKVKDVKQQAENANEDIRDIKKSYSSVKEKGIGMKKNIFFSNPMRGIPFWYRFETGYNFQTVRQGIDNRPAMLIIGLSALFRQTPRLSYGTGVSGSLGLGHGWRDIRLSNEGLSVQGIVDYKVFGKVSIQGVCEYTIGGSAYANSLPKDENINSFFGKGRQAVYLGMFTRTNVGKRRQVTFFIGYDFLWRNNMSHTPMVFKLGFGKRQ